MGSLLVNSVRFAFAFTPLLTWIDTLVAFAFTIAFALALIFTFAFRHGSTTSCIHACSIFVAFGFTHRKYGTLAAEEILIANSDIISCPSRKSDIISWLVSPGLK